MFDTKDIKKKWKEVYGFDFADRGVDGSRVNISDIMCREVCPIRSLDWLSIYRSYNKNNIFAHSVFLPHFLLLDSQLRLKWG